MDKILHFINNYYYWHKANNKTPNLWAGVLLYIFPDRQQITNHQTYKQGFYCASVSTGKKQITNHQSYEQVFCCTSVLTDSKL